MFYVIVVLEYDIFVIANVILTTIEEIIRFTIAVFLGIVFCDYAVLSFKHPITLFIVYRHINTREDVWFSVCCPIGSGCNHTTVCLVIVQQRHGMPPDEQREVVWIVSVLSEIIGKNFDIDHGFQSGIFSEKPEACVIIISITQLSIFIKNRTWMTDPQILVNIRYLNQCMREILVKLD